MGFFSDYKKRKDDEEIRARERRIREHKYREAQKATLDRLRKEEMQINAKERMIKQAQRDARKAKTIERLGKIKRGASKLRHTRIRGINF